LLSLVSPNNRTGMEKKAPHHRSAYREQLERQCNRVQDAEAK
jgi:hypothetical protein